MDRNRERLIVENLEYDKTTGKLFWKNNRRGTARKGTEAGFVNNRRYREIKIANKSIKAHRVVWFIWHGEWPGDEVDHINGDRLDNRIENLRVVNHRANTCNKEMHRAGKLVGTRFDNRRIKNPWMSRIKLDGNQIYLGCFPTEEEAHSAYIKALEEYSMPKASPESHAPDCKIGKLFAKGEKHDET